MMVNTGKEALRWFETFVPLYEKAASLVRHIADIEALKAGRLPTSLYALVESNLTLGLILQVVRKMPKPEEKELASIQQEFQIALSSCIKAAETAAKYVELVERGIEDRALLNIVINSTVLAHEYIESVSTRLEVIRRRMSDLPAKSEPEMVVEDYLKAKKTPRVNIAPPPPRPQLYIDRIAVGVEHGLDRLGDAMIFSIDKIARYARRLKTRNRKRGKGEPLR